jgi:hypothetical protein
MLLGLAIKGVYRNCEGIMVIAQKYAVVRSVDDALATLRTWGWL